ncbi:hypothetical protein QBC47DRAFT_404298 [Echria macrotheca]|uniref:F-box domain-containing protein n=1 Tax=Echria macrotheca TaxID=438768 RepID=A0AAJ0F722_9PEZI|nr:hypothetical protein QBC47DRAFT_404298 [Echria macrotheca]
MSTNTSSIPEVVQLRSKIGLESLPDELLLKIAQHLAEPDYGICKCNGGFHYKDDHYDSTPQPSDLANFAGTSRRIHPVASEVLYSTDARDRFPKAMLWGALTGQVGILEQSLAFGGKPGVMELTSF